VSTNPVIQRTDTPSPEEPRIEGHDDLRAAAGFLRPDLSAKINAFLAQPHEGLDAENLLVAAGGAVYAEASPEVYDRFVAQLQEARRLAAEAQSRPAGTRESPKKWEPPDEWESPEPAGDRAEAAARSAMTWREVSASPAATEPRGLASRVVAVWNQAWQAARRLVRGAGEHAAVRPEAAAGSEFWHGAGILKTTTITTMSEFTTTSESIDAVNDRGSQASPAALDQATIAAAARATATFHPANDGRANATVSSATPFQTRAAATRRGPSPRRR
jgi:hypothetical protein